MSVTLGDVDFEAVIGPSCTYALCNGGVSCNLVANRAGR